MSRLDRPRSGRWLRIQAQVSQDLLDRRPLQDGRDDLQFPTAAVWALAHVDVEDPLGQPRPADAVRPGVALNRLALADAATAPSVACSCTSGPCGTTHDRSFALGASTAETAALTAEGREHVVVGIAAAQSQEAVGQDAAREEGVELVLDEPQQLRAGAGLGIGDEAGRVLLHQLVQRGLLGAMALVTERAVGGFATA